MQTKLSLAGRKRQKEQSSAAQQASAPDPGEMPALEEETSSQLHVVVEQSSAAQQASAPAPSELPAIEEEEPSTKVYSLCDVVPRD